MFRFIIYKSINKLIYLVGAFGLDLGLGLGLGLDLGLLGTFGLGFYLGLVTLSTLDLG